MNVEILLNQMQVSEPAAMPAIACVLWRNWVGRIDVRVVGRRHTRKRVNGFDANSPFVSSARSGSRLVASVAGHRAIYNVNSVNCVSPQ